MLVFGIAHNVDAAAFGRRGHNRYKAGVANVTYIWDTPDYCSQSPTMMPSDSPTVSPSREGLLHFGDCSQYGNADLQIGKGSIDLVGRIPAGAINAKIEIKSNVDIDLILLDSSSDKFEDDPDAIISYIDQKTRKAGINTALMMGAGYQVKEYYGRNYSWSGYEGLDGDSGHEVVQIHGNANRNLQLRVYGWVQNPRIAGFIFGKPVSPLCRHVT